MEDRDTTVRLYQVVYCDILYCGNIARYDAKTSAGPWAYLCGNHYVEMGVGLGLGKGQRIVYTDPDKAPALTESEARLMDGNR